MALLYPLHTPNVPLQWEDHLWVSGVGTAEELLLLRIAGYKEKTAKEKEFLMYWNERVVGLRSESDDEDQDTDE